MDDELTPEQKFAAEDAETMVPRALLIGRKPEEIVTDLVRLDWSLPAARDFVARVIEDMRQFRESRKSREQLLANVWRQFIGGLLMMVAGCALGALAVIAMVAGGLVLFGLTFVTFFGGLVLAGRGWSRWRLYSGVGETN
jgi:sterol desaturase/sphingolipid hydroxylase (fatty acid hydroxylase superfamily)